jgi:predicted CXXCH cytochrome family protein
MTALRAALLASLAAGLWAQEPADTCLTCHAALEGNLAVPAQRFEQDIHKKAGVSCADCHGGDPTTLDPGQSMSRARGFVGKISRRDVPARCARCHSDAALIHKFAPQQRVDQLALYRTSVHGRRLAAGDERVANCVDCHSVHDIRMVRAADSPVHPLRLPETCARCHADAAHMKGYDIPTDQFDNYHSSVHWEALAKRGDLSAPSCATCHGNHGAAPPGVASVEHVCGSCHVVFENLFAKSPHKKAFDQMGLAACVVCHGNHDVKRPTTELVGVREGAVCLNCHSQGDKGYEAAAQMRARLEELRSALDRAAGILKRAETSGMEVSQALSELSAGQESLVKARVDLHAFDPALVDAAAKKGLQVAEAGYRAGERALADRDFRRKGLALSLATIAVTMIGLWLAVRELDRRRGRPV